MTQDSTIDQKALDSLSVAPPEPHENAHVHHPRQNAGQDESIVRRLKADPENKEARLDTALDESMDASDPPSSTQPANSNDPPASSGFDAEAEQKLQNEK